MKAVVLGGGHDQIKLIISLKERGYKVWMIDYYENPIAKPFCDHHIIQSTLNEEAVRAIIKSIKPDLVITCCTDQALLIVAKMAEEFNLYFPISFAQAMNLTNKKWMKNRLNQYSIPTAKSIAIKEYIPGNIIGNLTFPVIFKPVDSNSSKGVVKIDSISDLDKGYEYSKNFSRSGEVVCEEFIEGTEVSIDAYVRNGKAIYLMASTLEKLKSEEGNFPICRCKSPAKMSNKIRDKIERLLQQVADAFELSNCPLILQAIIHGDEVSVIELSARTGGGSKHYLLEYMTGIDVIESLIDDCEKKYNLINPNFKSSQMTIQYIYTEPCVFGSIQGLEQLKQRKKIVDYFIYKTTGMEIKSASNSSNRCCGYFYQSDADQNELISSFEVFDINGKMVKKIWK